jgi:WD40 repeat protein
MQWDLHNYQCIGVTPSAHTIHSIIILSQGGFITLSSEDSCIQIWDEDHICCESLPSCYDNQLLLSNGNLLCSIYHDFIGQTFIRIIDCKDGYKCVKRIVDNINSAKIAVNLSRNKYATAGEVIKIWDIDKNYECINTFEEHVGLITCLLYIERYDLLISGSKYMEIKVWDLKDRSYLCINTMEVNNIPGCLLYLPNGYFVVAMRNGMIEIWDFISGVCISSITGHIDKVTSLVLIKGRVLASASLDGRIILWA